MRGHLLEPREARVLIRDAVTDASDRDSDAATQPTRSDLNDFDVDTVQADSGTTFGSSPTESIVIMNRHNGIMSACRQALR